MAPPAGVEPTTYRLGGGPSYLLELAESSDKSTLACPIFLPWQPMLKGMILLDVDFRFGRISPEVGVAL